MEITFDKNLLKNTHIDIDGLVKKISTGKAILFTGAGFSIGTTNIENVNNKGSETPLASELARKICNLGDFPEDDDLSYASEFYLENNSPRELIKLLKRNYTLAEVGSQHVSICKANWKRFYTTNYDKSIEIASAKAGEVVECVDLYFKPSEYYKREKLCIHLNGSIDSLHEKSFENAFKLSTSSYISADSFVTSQWNYHFKRDLERSSAIVFVGYSLYDIDIQKILKENENFKEKTYFITRDKNIDPKLKFKLSKFGHIIPIGTEGFASLIEDNISSINSHKKNKLDIQALSLFETPEKVKDIRDNDVENMLLYGRIESEHVIDAVLGVQKIPYLVIRDTLETVYRFCKENKHTVILGDLGNGKSFFLKELFPYLSVNSIDVYEITDDDADYIEDIDELSKQNKNIVLIIDGYARYLNTVIKHFSSTLPSNISLVISSRTSEHEKLRPKLKELALSFNELNIDILTYEEASSFVNIIDNVGMWGKRASLSHKQKISFLERDNKSQISLSLLGLFEAPQIKERIASLLAELLKNEKYKSTVFSIAFLEVLGLPVSFGLISEVSQNDEIYSSRLTQDNSFSDLFTISRNEVSSKSSLFCLSLIKNHFTASYITKQLHIIATKFVELDRSGSHEYETIFKSTIRFSFIERLLPKKQKITSLRRYHEDLKKSIPWLKNDPHFWLQYGMAYISLKDYPKAQQFLEQAYSLASLKNDYHAENIDTQQARLYLQSTIDGYSKDINLNFRKAHNLLSKVKNDIFKYRQVIYYKPFYDNCYNRLPDDDKKNFINSCNKMLSDIEKGHYSGDIDRHRDKPVSKSESDLIFIIESSLKN